MKGSKEVDPIKSDRSRRNRKAGIRNERRLANIFTSEGIDARRTNQSARKANAADVILLDYPQYFIELKCFVDPKGAPPFPAVYDKAMEDKREFQAPIFVFHSPKGPWLVIREVDSTPHHIITKPTNLYSFFLRQHQTQCTINYNLPNFNKTLKLEHLSDFIEEVLP